MSFRLRMIDEPANILVQSLSEHKQLNFAQKFWTNQQKNDIYGDHHNYQIESLKWTVNHTINRFHGFNKYVLVKENHQPYA